MEFAVCLHTERLDSFSTTAERDYEPKVSSFVVLFVFFKAWQRLVWDNNAFLFYQTRFSREYDKFQLKLICKHPLAFLCICILIQLWLYLSLSPSWLCLILISAFQQMFLTRHVFNLFTGNSQNIQTKTRRAHQSSSNLQQRHQ